MPMACLDMYNSNQHKKGHCPPMSPRISFSNDFVDSSIKQERSNTSRDQAPVSSDFEFSVTNYSMMSADELFFKGRLLPFKDNGSSNQMQRTIRDELLVDDDGEDEVSMRPPKNGSTRWKGLLGLRKSHSGSKKADKNDAPMERYRETRRSGSVFLHDEEMHGAKNSQEILNEASSSSSCTDVDIGM